MASTDDPQKCTGGMYTISMRNEGKPRNDGKADPSKTGSDGRQLPTVRMIVPDEGYFAILETDHKLPGPQPIVCTGGPSCCVDLSSSSAASSPESSGVPSPPTQSDAVAIKKLADLLRMYPLASRPYFAPARRRHLSDTDLASLKIRSGIIDDFYLNLLDWGSSDLIALAANSQVLLMTVDSHASSTPVLRALGRLASNEMLSPRQPAGSSRSLNGDFRSPDPQHIAEPLPNLRSLMRAADPNTSEERWMPTLPSSPSLVVSVATPSSGDSTSLLNDITTPVDGHRVPSNPASGTDLTSVRWNPDGRQLAVGLRSGLVEVWDVQASQCTRTLNGHTHRVGALDWVPTGGGALLTTGSRDKSILIHDVRIGRSGVFKLEKHRQEVCGLKWRTSDVHEAAQMEGPMKQAEKERPQDFPLEAQSRVWSDDDYFEDLHERECQKAMKGPPYTTSDAKAATEAAIKSVLGDSGTASGALGNGHMKLASGGNDNKVYVWEFGYTNPLLRLSVHNAAVKALAWAPVEHPLLLTGGGTNDRTIRLWDIERRRELGVTETECQVCNLYWSPVTLEIVSSHGYTLNQINVWSLQAPSMDTGGGASATDCANADGSIVGLSLATAPLSVPMDGTRPFNLEKLATLTGHTARVLYMSASPCGRRVATAAGDGFVRLWGAFEDAQ